jgi:vancomycin resistance protein YoaR
MRRKTAVATVTALFLVLVGIAGAGGGYMYKQIKDYSNAIYPEVVIEHIDFSGRTKEETEQMLKEKYGDIVLKKKISVKSSGKTYVINYLNLNARYNIEQVVNEAFSYGKNLGFLDKYKLIKSPVPTYLRLEFTYDIKPVKELIAGMQKELDKAPVNASITMPSSGSFTITPEKSGVKLNAEKLEANLSAVINGDLGGDIEIEAPLDEVQPAVTAAMLSKVNTKVASFSTSFAGSSANRVENIRLATNSISGRLFLPGESFGFNDVVGKRTAERGYKEAPVIIDNKLESDLGGGICQVSTTLYNAVIRVNINATERHIHTLPSHYIGLGMDATVDYGNLDYKFKNTLEYPIFIEGYIDGNTIGFNIYSDGSLTAKTYDLVNEVYETLQPEIKYVDDPNMYEGQTETVQKASIGYKVKVFKRIYENGTLIGQEQVSNSIYKPVNGIVKRGIKKRY